MSTPAVIIESIIKRKGGSVIPMGGMTYHFQPDDNDRHVATVTDADHIARFLQIAEGFRLLGTTAIPAAPASAAPVGVTAAAVTPQASPVSPSEPTAPPEPMAQAAPATEATTPGPANAGEKPLDQMTDAELRTVFRAELGRPASPKSKIETMIAQIEAVRAERAAAQ